MRTNSQRHDAKLGPLVVGWMAETITGGRWWCRNGRKCFYFWLALGRVHLIVSTLPVWGWHWWARGLSLPDRVPSLLFAGRFWDLSIKLRGVN